MAFKEMKDLVTVIYESVFDDLAMIARQSEVFSAKEADQLELILCGHCGIITCCHYQGWLAPREIHELDWIGD